MSETWSGQRVERWIGQSAGLDLQFAAVSALLFETAALQPGEAVLDVGCGTGSTSRTASLAVGSAGRVTGLDVSSAMLAAASAHESDVEWLEADVTNWDPPAAWDVVISRFGVMFFDDPARAFAGLAGAIRPGGRLCCAVWSRRDESDLFAIPLAAAAEAVGSIALPPDDLGPFSLSDDAFVRGLLTGAGWSDVEIATHVLALPFCGGLPVAEAAVAALDYGPLRTVTEQLSDADRARVVASVAAAMTGQLDGDGHVVLDASIRILTARRP